MDGGKPANVGDEAFGKGDGEEVGGDGAVGKPNEEAEK